MTWFSSANTGFDHPYPLARSDYIRLFFARGIILDHGAASPTSGRGAQPERSGRIATTPVDDEHDGGSGFLSKRTLGVSDRTGAFPQREGDPGASPGMEPDEEVALIDRKHQRVPEGGILPLQRSIYAGWNPTVEMKACED